MSIQLTDAQRQRMEASKQRALELRRAKQAELAAAAAATSKPAAWLQQAPPSVPNSSPSLSGVTPSAGPPNHSYNKSSVFTQPNFNSSIHKPNFNITSSNGINPIKKSFNNINPSSIQKSTILGSGIAPPATKSTFTKSSSSYQGPNTASKSVQSSSFYGSSKSSSGISASSSTASSSSNSISQSGKALPGSSAAAKPAPGSPAKPVFTGKPLTGTLALISQDRFAAVVDYHQALVELFKTMPTRKYDAESRRWTFALSDHSALVQKLLPMRPAVCIAALPPNVLRVLREASCLPPLDSVQLTCLDPSLEEALLPFQREGVKFGVRRQGRVLIADDMGLGKTIQALAIASYYRSEWPLLVVTPSSVRYSWLGSVERWLSVRSSTVINSSQDRISGSEVVITSYDLLARRAKEFRENKFGVVIMDESHMLKSFKSARYKAAQPLMKSAQRVVLLSGTPALSRPSELYTQINSVDSKLFPNFQDYGVRYCAGFQGNWGWDFSGSSNLQELQVLLQSLIMIRRLKSEVLEQLPGKQRQVVILDPGSIKTNTSKALLASAAQLELKSLNGSERHGALLQFFAQTATAKMKAVSEYVKELVEAGQKFLVFAHHRVMLDNLSQACERNKVMYIRIEGSTPGDTRQALVDEFQQRDDVRVAVLSITAASTGITLTAASLVVFAELYWNPGILVQAEDRVHRLGQKDSVSVQYLVARGTADDHIWPMVQHKLNVLSQAGLSKDNFSDSDATFQKADESNSITQYLVDMTPDELAEMEQDFEVAATSQEDLPAPAKKPKLS